MPGSSTSASDEPPREAGDLLRDALPLVELEPGTLAWFALRFGPADFGVFASFRDLASRRSHLDGSAHQIVWKKAPLVFDGEPHVDELDVLADKLPVSGPYGPIMQGVLLDFPIKPGQDRRVRELLTGSFEAIEREQRTTAWFALHLGADRCGSFAVFADKGARFRHLAGHLPQELVKHALSLLEALPELEMPEVLSAKIAA
jgi:hypothetical protein